MLGILLIGCSKAHENKTSKISLVPTVKAQQPELRDIRMPIAQPGKIEAFEQTAIYSKISGFVQKWHVDIGTHVKKGQLLVELMVPELADEHAQKEAQVEQSNANVQQFDKLVSVAQSNVLAAKDAVVEARANIKRYDADVERWQGELT